MAFETTLTAERVDQHTARRLLDEPDHHRLPRRRRPPRTPDKIAVHRPPRAGSPTASCAARSTGARSGLLELGVRPGDVVSFQLPNWIEFLVLHYAATRIGAINNPLIPIYRDREVGFMVGLAQSKVIVVPREFRGFDYPRDGRAAARGLAGPRARARRRRAPARAPGPGPSSSATPWEERRDPAELAALRPGPERRHAADLHLRHHR